jgi:lauroyl/myristoyl acyltransferase
MNSSVIWMHTLNTVKGISKLVLPSSLHIRRNFFDYPLSKKVLIKKQILKHVETLYYKFLTEQHFNLINRSCINIDALSSLPRNKTIFLFFHQPFVRYLSLWFSEKGFVVHAVGKRKRITPYPYFVSILESQSKHYSYYYKPLITLKILLDLLNKGEIILLAADGRLGKHFIPVKFGNGTLKTPRGIYMLGQATGAYIVPVFIRLRRTMPSPKFELLVGDSYQFQGSPEEEIEKIESIFSWYYFNVIEQPYMWKRIALRQ